jgi:hypothetical protein
LKNPQRHAEVAEGQTHLLIGLRPAVSKFNAANPVTYGVEIRPLLVATIRRFPQRKMDSTLPTPGIMSPLDTLRMPSGPSKTAVPLATSRSVQPSIVVGLVSGVGASLTRVCRSLAIDGVVGVAPTDDFVWFFVDEGETLELCGNCAEDGRSV